MVWHRASPHRGRHAGASWSGAWLRRALPAPAPSATAPGPSRTLACHAQTWEKHTSLPTLPADSRTRLWRRGHGERMGAGVCRRRTAHCSLASRSLRPCRPTHRMPGTWCRREGSRCPCRCGCGAHLGLRHGVCQGEGRPNRPNPPVEAPSKSDRPPNSSAPGETVHSGCDDGHGVRDPPVPALRLDQPTHVGGGAGSVART